DYYMIGNSVQLNFTPTNGQLIAIKTFTFISMARNSTFVANRYVSDGVVNAFDSGIIQAEPGQLFVTIDGVMQQPDVGAGLGTYDYRIESQDVSISSMTSVGTTVTVNTTADHGFNVGNTVKIFGAAQTDYNGSFSITVVPSTTSFKYEAASAPSG